MQEISNKQKHMKKKENKLILSFMIKQNKHKTKEEKLKVVLLFLYFAVQF